jgi:hypothetical protein
MADDSQTWSQTIDTMFTSTWSYRKKKATEQAFLKTPLIFWFRKKERIENISGHTRIEIPLEYGSNDTVRWISKGDTVPITDAEYITMAYENWKYVSVSIPRFFEDDQKNRGEAKMISMIDTKLGAAERALNEEFEAVLHSDGSGAKEPNGLQNLIATDPTTGTLHGIDRSAYSWFRNQQKTSSGSSALYLISDMRTALNNCLRYAGTELNDIIIMTTQSIFEYYEDECFEIKTLSNTMLADAGFDTVNFRGRPIIWGPSATAGNMYFINPSYIKMVCDETYWMDMTDWKTIPNQPNDKVAQIVCVFNTICSRPISQNVLTGITE